MVNKTLSNPLSDDSENCFIDGDDKDISSKKPESAADKKK